jgi:CheY-like chemotaxis protein
MGRILLADDSPHAQRMGERILREEGYEVVSVTDGDTALLRLGDVDPDVIIADVFLPGRSGIEICRTVKNGVHHRHVKVIVTAGLLETFNEDEARRAGADAILKKPFEASAMLEALKPLLVEAQLARGMFAEAADAAPESKPVQTPRPAPVVETRPPAAAAAAPGQEPEIDVERVRAAVTLAVDAAMPALIDELTQKVLLALKQRSG